VMERLTENPCHIYMICRRPRIAIDPTTFMADEESISLDFIVQQEDRKLRFGAVVPNRLGTAKISLDCNYPYTWLTIRDDQGEAIMNAKSALLAASLEVKSIKEFLDLEIMYIGQAYGQEGSRTAPDRLESHSTLQAIYSEAISESPDKEIWLMLWNFAPMLITSFDGRWKTYQTTMEEDDLHIDKLLNEPMTEQQQINFTEAAMINYFQPQFNKTFKNRFPSPAHATYSECYDLDLNSVLVEMNTEAMFAKTFSDAIPPEWHHIANYSLHSPEERRSMFAILVPDEHSKEQDADVKA
jgi:hypothetical protein